MSSATRPAQIMLVAGEASGDIHGAKLVQEIKKILPDAAFYGLAGKHMQHVGVEKIHDVSELSVVGLVEVLKHYPRLQKILKNTKQIILKRPPDLLILIDSPDFNFRLLKTAKNQGVKVMYYISPQIWAWRSQRIKIIKKYVDLMAVVFPFEEKFYKDANVPVEYTGHPLVKEAHATYQKYELFKKLNLDPSKKLIGLFPGSRNSEIEKNYPALLEAAVLLCNSRNDVQFVTPIASSLSSQNIQKFIDCNSLNVITTRESIYNVINACDAIAAASGTVTLQITLMQTPMLIVYKISPLTYQILKKLVNFKFAGIANVIANKEICKEFIQDNATAMNISQELNKLLLDKTYTENMKTEMAKIKDTLSEKPGAETAAKLAVHLIST